MKKALIIYSGVDGQTYKIANHIADQIACQYQVSICNISETDPLSLIGFDMVIIGAAIRYGYFAKNLLNYINNNAATLNQLFACFYSVTLTARKDGKKTSTTNSYTRKFLNKTAWQPKQIGVFAGALHYPKYTWYDRQIIQLIMKITGGETDTTQDIEYTNWQDVTDFSQNLLQHQSISVATIHSSPKE